MKTVEIIELLDEDANKYGGTTGKERELNLSINGDFVGSIEFAKLDGWGDGLVTDVTLEVKVSDIDYHDRKIREKTIDDFAEKFIYKAACEGCSGCCNCYEESRQNECEDYKSYMTIAEQLKAGGENE